MWWLLTRTAASRGSKVIYYAHFAPKRGRESLKQAIDLLEADTGTWNWKRTAEALYAAYTALPWPTPAVRNMDQSPLAQNLRHVCSLMERARYHIQRHDRVQCLRSMRPAAVILQVCIEQENPEDPEDGPSRETGK